jgi:transcriptional regulator with XRE-family HTH domain
MINEQQILAEKVETLRLNIASLGIKPALWERFKAGENSLETRNALQAVITYYSFATFGGQELLVSMMATSASNIEPTSRHSPAHEKEPSPQPTSDTSSHPHLEQPKTENTPQIITSPTVSVEQPTKAASPISKPQKAQTSDIDFQTVGAAVEVVREHKKIDRRAFSNSAGIDPHTLLKLERGGEVAEKSLSKILAQLELNSVQELLLEAQKIKAQKPQEDEKNKELYQQLISAIRTVRTFYNVSQPALGKAVHSNIVQIEEGRKKELSKELVEKIAKYFGLESEVDLISRTAAINEVKSHLREDEGVKFAELIKHFDLETAEELLLKAALIKEINPSLEQLEKNYLKTLGTAIRLVRQIDKEKSQAEIAQEFGVATSKISAIELGNNTIEKDGKTIVFYGKGLLNKLISALGYESELAILQRGRELIASGADVSKQVPKRGAGAKKSIEEPATKLESRPAINMAKPSESQITVAEETLPPIVSAPVIKKTAPAAIKKDPAKPIAITRELIAAVEALCESTPYNDLTLYRVKGPSNIRVGNIVTYESWDRIIRGENEPSDQAAMGAILKHLGYPNERTAISAAALKAATQKPITTIAPPVQETSVAATEGLKQSAPKAANNHTKTEVIVEPVPAPKEATSAAQEYPKDRRAVLGGLILQAMRTLLEKDISDFPELDREIIAHIEQGNIPINDKTVAIYAQSLTPEIPEASLKERMNHMIRIIEEKDPDAYGPLEAMSNEHNRLKNSGKKRS